MEIKEGTIWLIANNEFLTANHFNQFNFENCRIIHFNAADHVHYFKNYRNTLILNNFTGWGGGFHGYSKIPHNYEKFEELGFSLQTSQLNNPTFLNPIKEVGNYRPTFILNSDASFEAFPLGHVPSIGYITLKDILSKYPDKTINLIGFTGGYTIDDKIYGFGHSWDIERKFIEESGVTSHLNSLELLKN